MSQPVAPSSARIEYPPGFRRRRGQNWGFLGLLYTSFYMCRYNLSIANKSISTEFNFSKANMGTIITTALQILISATVHEMVRTAAIAPMRDLGAWHLKGVTEAIRVFEVGSAERGDTEDVIGPALRLPAMLVTPRAFPFKKTPSVRACHTSQSSSVIDSSSRP